MIERFFRSIAPVAALAIGALVAGCDNAEIRLGDRDMVPLAELDQSGPPPRDIVQAGPDNVILSTGPALDIAVSGDPDAVEALRFSLDEGTLAIGRKRGNGNNGGIATVRVTMPAPRSITLAGSGAIDAAELTGDPKVTIAGSGSAKVGRITAETLDVTLAGSGEFTGVGSAETLQMTIAGSGRASLQALNVESADLTIAGTGSAEFASDGKVSANIVGSGSVTVLGRADCTVSAMGSGTLNCREGTVARTNTSSASPRAPAAPAAPVAPMAPTDK